METKKEFRWFSIAQHVQEQDYLREQHKKGWKFVKVTGLGMYHFEKCAPEDVVYQLDYNPDGSAHKDEYLQMFADFGFIPMCNAGSAFHIGGNKQLFHRKYLLYSVYH